MSMDKSTEHVVRIAELETENRMLKEQIKALQEQQQFDRDQMTQLIANQSTNNQQTLKKWW